MKVYFCLSVNLYQWRRHTDVFIYKGIWTFLLHVMSQLSEDYGHHYKLVICDIFDFADLPLNIVFFGASA